MHSAAASRRSSEMEAARRLAAARIRTAGIRMRLAAVRRLDTALHEPIRAGDAVRVSILVLPHVRRQLKSQLVGDALPLFSTSLFRVTDVVHDAEKGRTLYNVTCTSCWGGNDPLPSVVNGWLAQLPTRLESVERRYLLRIPPRTRGTMGRTQPDALPVLWARGMVMGAALPAR